MSWMDILKNTESDITSRITNAPQYVKTAWGEVLRWLGEQQ